MILFLIIITTSNKNSQQYRQLQNADSIKAVLNHSVKVYTFYRALYI